MAFTLVIAISCNWPDEEEWPHPKEGEDNPYENWKE